MSPLVSVIIPSYNHERYLPHAVESVLSQSYQDCELIIVDDGSHDGSVDYITALNDHRVRTFLQTNQGAHAAINRGIREARGEYIAILNSDDAFEQNRIARALQVFQDVKDVSLVTSWVSVIDDNGVNLGIKRAWENLAPWPMPDQNKSYGTDDGFFLNLLASNFVATTSNIVVRRDIALKLKGMRNLRFAHDWDFLLRVAASELCYLIEEPLLQYRIHRRNTITSNRAWMLFEICWIWAVHLRNFATRSKPGSISAQSSMIAEFERLDSSINPQGNDRTIWELMLFIDVHNRRGVQFPEEMLLEDAALREFFVQRIRDKERMVVPPRIEPRDPQRILSAIRKSICMIRNYIPIRRTRL